MVHLYALFIVLLACTPQAKMTGESPAVPEKPVKTFLNPLLPSGADPWVIGKDGLYYYTHTSGNRIELRATPRMEELAQNAWLALDAGDQPEVLLFETPPEKRYDAALKRLGLEPWMLGAGAGRA